jgi:hypothetical protein
MHKTLQLCFERILPSTNHPASLGLLATALLFSAGCATRPTAAVTHGGAPTTELTLLEPGPVTVKCAPAPARFSFDKSSGRTRYVGDGAAEAARKALDKRNLGDPGIDVGAGAVGFALAPFAAAIGAVTAGQSKATPEALTACESNLREAMTAMAAQAVLRDSLLKAASLKTQRRFIPVESPGDSRSEDTAASARLETTVEELRLQKTTRRDDSFALLIKTRLRLVRAADGAVLYNEPFEFRSGPALFIDWSSGDAFQRVAQTGYRQIAEQMAEQLSMATRDEPLLAGAGFIRSPSRLAKAPLQLASSSRTVTSNPDAQYASFAVVRLDPLAVLSSDADPYPHVALQSPLTKEEATEKAQRDVGSMVAGLDAYGNSVITMGAIAAAVPLSLFKQTIGCVSGLTTRQFKAAEANLTAACREARPHEELATQVAQCLEPHSALPVVLVSQPLRGKEDFQPRASGSPDNILEIRILSASLKGRDGINPPLALCVEAQATLLRASDGQELYSCSLRYRSDERKFADWGTDNARAFRSEMNKCHRELGRAIVNQLEDRKLIAPSSAPRPTFASKSN